jgi:hypothetical protein
MVCTTWPKLLVTCTHRYIRKQHDLLRVHWSYIHACMYAYTYVHADIVYIYIYIYTYICMYIYIYTHTHICTCTHMYIAYYIWPQKSSFTCFSNLKQCDTMCTFKLLKFTYSHIYTFKNLCIHTCTRHTNYESRFKYLCCILQITSLCTFYIFIRTHAREDLNSATCTRAFPQKITHFLHI